MQVLNAQIVTLLLESSMAIGVTLLDNVQPELLKKLLIVPIVIRGAIIALRPRPLLAHPADLALKDFFQALHVSILVRLDFMETLLIIDVSHVIQGVPLALVLQMVLANPVIQDSILTIIHNVWIMHVLMTNGMTLLYAKFVVPIVQSNFQKIKFSYFMENYF